MLSLVITLLSVVADNLLYFVCHNFSEFISAFRVVSIYSNVNRYNLCIYFGFT